MQLISGLLVVWMGFSLPVGLCNGVKLAHFALRQLLHVPGSVFPNSLSPLLVLLVHFLYPLWFWLAATSPAIDIAAGFSRAVGKSLWSSVFRT